MTPQGLLRALVVEDSQDDEELVVMELQAGGYQVEHVRVETEPAMRAALAQQKWDIILSDFAMPEFSGPRALAVLKGLGLDIPFIIVSGTVGEEAAVAAMRSGANDYVLKKSLARLCPAIEREIREAQSRAQQRKMQEQLLISDRMASVGTLATGVAHEINNPLSAIIANLDLMTSDIEIAVEELDSGARFQEIFGELRDAKEGAERLRQIVRDLKLFSRSSDEERHGPIDVKRAMESSLRMAWNEIRHRARLVKEYNDIPPVGGNEARLGQVFLNLLVNAAQAIPEGDTEHNVVRIATKLDTSSGMVIVEVRDTGSGIAPENLSHIFDAFFTTKPIGVGTGLGLSICHKIVTGLAGRIEVESQLGIGTLFRILLPVFTGKPEGARPVLTAPFSRRRGRILIIDDEAIVGRAFAHSLRRDHDVVVSQRGANALDLLSFGERFDLILCDLMMPQMTGMELYTKLEETLPEQAARMVFMTGGAFTPRARSFLDARPDNRIEKPISSEELRAFVNSRIT